MDKDAVKQVLADLVARDTIAEGDTFTFPGLRKNACCYLRETGLNDSEAGSILGMSPDIVRHYGKRARALMIARGAVDRIAGGKVIALSGATALPATIKNGWFPPLVTPTGIEPVLQP